ncbi:MAG: metallophosphoesterase [Bacteroidales bacterium]|nr:metallophosphoesterase [Bacteroidales bacterium]
MKSQILAIGLVFFIFIVLVDIYSFRGISRLTSGLSQSNNLLLLSAFLLTGIVATGLIVWLMLHFEKYEYNRMMSYTSVLMGYMVLFYVPKLFFIVFIIIRDLALLINKITSSFSGQEIVPSGTSFISRADFILQAGIIVAMIPFVSIIYGIWKGRYNYKLTNIKLSFENLPASFKGLKIIQISDLHLGSFGDDTSKIKKAIDIINEQDADYVLFTGDAVNNLASEMEVFAPVLNEIKAKKGKYSILGNHDYGSYYPWASQEDLNANMELLYRLHEDSGFRLLRNETVFLEHETEKIALIGVENWGVPPFPQLGDLAVAMKNVKNTDFKILMSHDPSHWDAKVLPETNIDLTLSGHTHGMQFAINIPGFNWSPVKFKYPRWSGLYKEGKQYLYVNIGLGYIAFPGRVGTPPEITVFTFN